MVRDTFDDILESGELNDVTSLRRSKYLALDTLDTLVKNNHIDDAIAASVPIYGVIGGLSKQDLDLLLETLESWCVDGYRITSTQHKASKDLLKVVIQKTFA